MRAFARWPVCHRWWVIGGWVTLVLVLAGVSQLAGGAAYKNNVTFPSSDSQTAQAILQRDFPAAGDVDQIVFHATTGPVTGPAARGRIQPMLAKVAGLPHVVQVTSPYARRSGAISPDGRTAFATVTFDAQATGLPAAAINRVIDAAQAARTPALRVELGGQAIEQVESSGPGPLLAVGLGAAVLVLLVLFGSVTAMLMPIVTALVAIGAGISVNALITHVMDVGAATEAIALMIALGVGIDYSLFIVSRFRALLAEGRDPKQAAAGAVNTSGRAVLFAGMGRVSGVITGAAVIMIAVFGSFALGGQLLLQQIGIGFAVAVALDAFLIRFVLVPAVMCILGERNWQLPRWLNWLPHLHIEPGAPRGTGEPAEALPPAVPAEDHTPAVSE